MPKLNCEVLLSLKVLNQYNCVCVLQTCEITEIYSLYAVIL